MRHIVYGGVLILILAVVTTTGKAILGADLGETLGIVTENSSSFLIDTKFVHTRPLLSLSPALVDLDHDDDLEIIVMGTSRPGSSVIPDLCVIDGRSGYVILSRTLTVGSISSPSIADLNRDGAPEIILVDGREGVLCLDSRNGSLLWGWVPEEWALGGLWLMEASTPTLGDVDNDGFLEVIFGTYYFNYTLCPSRAYYYNFTYCLNGEDGTLLWRFETGDAVRSSPALGDVDGDSRLEVIFGSDDKSVYCLSGREGSLLWVFSLETASEEGGVSSASLGDVDGDSWLEVVVGLDPYLCVLDCNGSLLYSYRDEREFNRVPVLGDVDGDKHLEIIVIRFEITSSMTFPISGALYCFDVVGGGFRVCWNGLCGGLDFEGCYRTKNTIFLDPDCDTLSSYSERILGTSITNPDSDGDNLSDGWEVYHGLDPLNPDTDGDGYSDGYEISRGTDPLDPNDYPVPSVEERWWVLIVLVVAVVLVVFFLKRILLGKK